jgi:hypothetical protein
MGDKALRGNRLTRKDGGRTNLLEELGRVEAEPSNRNRRAEIRRVHSELNKGYKDGGRTNLLEELGRVEAEPSNRNRRAEIARVHGELNRGYAQGGRAQPSQSKRRRRGRGRDTEQDRKKDLAKLATTHEEGKKDHKPKSYLDKDTEKQVKTSQTGNVKKYKPFPKHMNWHTGRVESDEHKKLVKGIADIHAAHGGEGFKKGGRIAAKDGKWIQKATASIKRRGTKGVCTGKKFGGPTCRPGTKRYNLAKTFKKMARKG